MVEDVKILKDTVLSVIEMFARYDKFGGDTVQFLERRVKQNEIKLSNNAAFSQGNADIKASEREKLLKSIDADKRTIEFQKTDPGLSDKLLPKNSSSIKEHSIWSLNFSEIGPILNLSFPICNLKTGQR